jgi:elongation factor P
MLLLRLGLARSFPSAMAGAASSCGALRGGSLFPFAREYKKDCVDIRQGNTIEKDGKLYQVSKFEHTRGMARQSGNVQMELRELVRGGRGNKSTLRMKPGHTLEVVRLEEKSYQVLYLEGKVLQVMDGRTYDQMDLPLDLFESSIQQKLVAECTYLEEPPQITVLSHGEEVLSCKLPPTLDFVVDKAHDSLNSQSAKARDKDSYLQGGTLIKVPGHIEQGDSITVDTRDGSFVRKVQ